VKDNHEVQKYEFKVLFSDRSALIKFLGIEAAQAHEAFSDTLDSAKLMVQFLRFHRRQASVEKFKGAFGR